MCGGVGGGGIITCACSGDNDAWGKRMVAVAAPALIPSYDSAQTPSRTPQISSPTRSSPSTWHPPKPCPGYPYPLGCDPPSTPPDNLNPTAHTPHSPAPPLHLATPVCLHPHPCPPPLNLKILPPPSVPDLHRPCTSPPSTHTPCSPPPKQISK